MYEVITKVSDKIIIDCQYALWKVYRTTEVGTVVIRLRFAGQEIHGIKNPYSEEWNLTQKRLNSSCIHLDQNLSLIFLHTSTIYIHSSSQKAL